MDYELYLSTKRKKKEGKSNERNNLSLDHLPYTKDKNDHLY